VYVHVPNTTLKSTTDLHAHAAQQS